jgi:inhibitor of cysteine peptidase
MEAGGLRMSRARLYAVLAGLAVLAGILLPYIASVLGGGLTPVITITSPIPYRELVTAPIYRIPGAPQPPSVGAITATGGFNDYGELYRFLQTSSERRFLESDLASLPLWGVVEGLARAHAVAPLAETATRLPMILYSRGGVTGAPEPGVRVSWTNVQVVGVDELDIVKTNGLVLAVVGGSGYSQVYMVDVRGKSVASVIKLPEGEVARGLFLDGWRLVVVSESSGPFRILDVGGLSFSCYNVNVTVRVFDVSNPKSPTMVGEVRVSGGLVDGRLYNGTVYLVINQPALVQGAPSIPVVDRAPITPRAIIPLGDEAERYVTVLALRVDDVAYNVVSIVGGPATRIYMSYDRLYVTSTKRVGVTEAYTIALRELANMVGGEWGSRIMEELQRGNVRKALDIANEMLSSMNREEAIKLVERLRVKLKASNVTLTDRTMISVLRVNGIDIKPVGSTAVKGVLLDQFAVEEYKGRYLIIATTTSNYAVDVTSYHIEIGEMARGGTPTNTTMLSVMVCYPQMSRCEHIKVAIPPYIGSIAQVLPPIRLIAYPVITQADSGNSVYIVDVETLKLVGSLEKLAPGERVYAARLVKDVFFLVTFRTVDPLFAIDVSDPSNPRVLGFLKIPGFSEYLHPLPGDMLLGIGLSGWSVIKISLFNVSNPTSMSEVSSVEIVEATSVALSDHHAVTVDLDYKNVYIPIQMIGKAGGGVAVVSFEDNKLRVVTILPHPGATRSIYIGRELYTVSQWGIVVFDIEDLKEVAVIKFQ